MSMWADPSESRDASADLRPVSGTYALAAVGAFVSQCVAALAGLHRLCRRVTLTDLLSRASVMPLMMPHVMLLAFVEIHDLLEPRPRADPLTELPLAFLLLGYSEDAEAAISSV